MDALTAQAGDNRPDAPAPQREAGRESIESIHAIDPDGVCPEFVKRVPIAFARQFSVLGLEQKNGIMPVALGSRESLHVLDKIRVLLGIPTRPLLIDEKTLSRAINRAYGLQESGIERVIDDMDATSTAALLEQLSGPGDLLDSDGASPVTRLVNLILLDAVKRRASDVHVQPYEDHLRVRLRIDGVLYDYVQPPGHLFEEIVSRIKVMGRMNIAEKRIAQDGRTTVRVGDKVIDLRISSLPTSYGERVVLRLLDKSARLYRLPELGLNKQDLENLRSLIRQTHGIILVSGPTGSGKSTTLYAALQELNSRELNILTLEDPIEYQLPGISQTQVSDKKGMTFATGLRTVLRQDPDVIMVGEIRDQETARMAIQSSLTGHLVFSTLHTNDAAGAVARLLDLGVEPYLVAGSLLAVLAQRLVRRVCPRCCTRGVIAGDDRRLLQLEEEIEVSEAAGCDHCQQTGYRDRAGVFELLQVNEELQDRIAASPKSRVIKEAARRNGMTTLREDAVRKLRAGITTVEEVLRVTHADGTTNDGLRVTKSALSSDHS